MVLATETGRVRELFINSTRVLAEALEAKDPYTAGHSIRVADLSVQICRKMGCDRSIVAQVHLGAMLHDIGKIGVRESVLNKEGRLTPEEYQHIMQHMDIGRRILSPIFRGKSILDIVTYHHERWDGKGLPQGRKGTKTPIGARIVGLADAVDAMGSMRPYRPGKAPGEMVTEIKGNAGVQFDPEVVEAFFATKYGRHLLEAHSEEPEHAPDATQETDTDDDQTRCEAAEDEVGDQAPLSAHAQEEPVLSAEAPPHEPLFSEARIFKAVRELKEVKALPFVTSEVLNLTSRANSDMNTLVDTILKDQALVAKVLKLANTSFYASRERVQTLDRAVLNIGVSGIRDMVLGIAVVDILNQGESSGHLDQLALWRHQLACAGLGKKLAAAGDSAIPEDVFVAGLLHDMGISLLDDLYPDEYAVCAEHAHVTGRPIVEAERDYIGADHTQVAAEFARACSLPEKLAMAMEMHHESWSALVDNMAPGITTVMNVKLAATMARACNIGSACDPLLEDIPNFVFKRLNLDEEKIAAVLHDFPMELTELEMVFFMNTRGDAKIQNPELPTELAGRKALFVEVAQQPFDPVAQFLKSLDMETSSARSVKEGITIQKPDLVLLRHTSDRAVENSLRQLSDLAKIGVVGAVKVFILGDYSDNGHLATLYPASCTAQLRPPFSIPNLTRSLKLFFAD